jgi:hypothetical protein
VISYAAVISEMGKPMVFKCIFKARITSPGEETGITPSK